MILINKISLDKILINKINNKFIRVNLILLLFSCLGLAESPNNTRLANGNDKIYRSTITNSMFDQQWIKQVFGLCPEALFNPTADCLQPILDPNNPLVFHSQRIINTIDGALRKRFPESFMNIPTPQVLMNPSKEFNAASLGSEVCFQVNVEPDFTSEKNVLDSYLEIRGPGLLVEHSKKNESVVCNLNPTVEQITHVIELFNLNQRNCRLRIDSPTSESSSFSSESSSFSSESSSFSSESSSFSSDKSPFSIKYEKNCFSSEVDKGFIRSQRLYLDTQGDRLVVNAGVYIGVENEETLWGILAHELAHYYRAHASGLLTAPNFFYSGLDQRKSEFPFTRTPRIDFTSLWQEFDKYSLLPETKAKFSGQMWHPLSYLFWDSLLYSECPITDNKCKLDCKKASEASAKLNENVEFNSYPQVGSLKNKSSALSEAYLKTEKLVRSCFSHFPYGHDEASIINLQADTIDAYWLSELGIIQKMTGKTIAEALDNFTKMLDDIESQWSQLVDHLQKNEVALYTLEQEADELAVTYLFLAGADPRWAALPEIKALKAASKITTYTNELDYKTCMIHRKENWPQDWVPVGFYQEPHHSLCFRIFNIDQEIKFWNYDMKKTNAVLLKKPQWQALQQLAIKMAK